jgi:multisubunit Na+/H+ antiporter MnhC subunit
LPEVVPPVPQSFLLEKIFIGVTLVVIVLVIVLIVLLLRSRYAKSRFKLLDNTGSQFSYFILCDI